MKDQDLSPIQIIGSPIQIIGLRDLDRALADASQFEGLFSYWHGHANLKWPLRAEVFRKPPRGRAYPEITLIRSSMAQAESRSQRCPPGDDLVGWLMLARHYGQPTRLLDWSHNPLVGLYFTAQVAEDSGDADGCLWTIEPGRLNLQMMGERRLMTADEPLARELFQSAFDPECALRSNETARGKCYAIGMREIDARVLVQQGAFTIHADAGDLADLDVNYPNSDARAPWRRAFRVPRAAKGQVLQFLRELGIYTKALCSLT